MVESAPAAAASASAGLEYEYEAPSANLAAAAEASAPKVRQLFNGFPIFVCFIFQLSFSALIFQHVILNVFVEFILVFQVAQESSLDDLMAQLQSLQSS